jgi:hypothetical protein
VPIREWDQPYRRPAAAALAIGFVLFLCLGGDRVMREAREEKVAML